LLDIQDTLAASEVLVVPNGLPSCVWLAVLHLLVSDTRLGERLGRCGAPRCGHYNISFRGKPQRHCSKKHRELFNKAEAAARMRAWRDRHAARLGAPQVTKHKRRRRKRIRRDSRPPNTLSTRSGGRL